MINVRNQLVGSPFEKDVTIECNVEASPKSINYWVKDVKDGKFADCFLLVRYVDVLELIIALNVVNCIVYPI